MNKTKFMALLLVLAMVITCGLTACGDADTASAASAASAEPVVEETAAPEATPAAPADNVVALDSSEEGTAGQTVAVTVSDPMEAMAEEFISYPLEGDNTITMWYYIPNYVDFMDSNFNYNAVSAAEEATGVHLDFQEVPASSADTQFSLLVAGGDMPDLIPMLEYYTDTMASAYENDIVLDIGDYIDEYMPNYAAVLECLPETTVNDTLTDGHTLAFYHIADGTYSGNGLVTRKDWLEGLNWEWSGDLIDLDEFTEYLRAIKEQYNPTYPIYMTDGTVGIEAAFDTEIPALVGDGFMTMVTSAIFRYDDEVASGWITDGYREYLEWALSMMDEGIMQQDFLSLDTDRMVQNTMQASGDIGIWQSNADKLEEIVDTYGSEYPELAVCGMPRVTNDPSQQYVWNDETALVSLRAGFSISASCKQPELVCQWQNYFWTTDGYYMANYGVEGESFHMDGEEPVFDWDQPVTVTGRNAPNAEMAQQLFTMARFVGYYVDNDMLLATFPESALEAVELWTVADSVNARNYPSAVSSSFTVEESEAIAEYEGDLLTYTAEQCLNFLTGAVELNDDTWNEYVSTCESMGINEIIDVYQTAYDQYLAGER